MASTKFRKRGSSIDKMTDKERRFCEEYLVDYDAKRAAEVAGYKHPAAQGCNMLKKPHIAAYVGRSQKLLVDKLELTREKVLLELYYCATRTSDDFVDERGRIKELHKLEDRAKHAIDGIKQKVRRWMTSEGEEVEEVETELKLVSKASALDMAMKHKGLFAAQESNVNLNADGLILNLLEKIARESRGEEVIDVEFIEERVKQPKLAGPGK